MKCSVFNKEFNLFAFYYKATSAVKTDHFIQSLKE